MYHTVKTLAVKKFGERGYCNALAEKTLAKKHVSFSCNQLEISAALPFRQVSKPWIIYSQNALQMKQISVFPGIILEINIDSLIAFCFWWDGYLKVNHCGSHNPWLSVSISLSEDIHPA